MTASVPTEVDIKLGTPDQQIISVGDEHGPDWFPVEVGTLRCSTTFFLRRAEATALRDRLTLALAHTDPKVEAAIAAAREKARNEAMVAVFPDAPDPEPEAA